MGFGSDTECCFYCFGVQSHTDTIFTDWRVLEVDCIIVDSCRQTLVGFWHVSYFNVVNCFYFILGGAPCAFRKITTKLSSGFGE